MKTRRNCYVYGLLLLLLCAGVYLLLFAPAEESFSPEENRLLAAKPSIQGDTLLEGAYGTELESYLMDRFPLRNRLIAVSQWVNGSLSLADYEDIMNATEGGEDQALAQAMAEYEQEDTDIPPVEEKPFPTPTQAAPLQTPADTETTESQPLTPAPTEQTSPPSTPEPMKTKNPLKVAAEGVDADKKDMYQIYQITGGKKSGSLARYSPKELKQAASVLNRLAEMLPEEGHVLECFVLSTFRLRKYINDDRPEGIASEIAPVLNALTEDRVITVPVNEKLGEAIAKGEYTHFRTDMHWTAKGAYLSLNYMLEQVDRSLPPFEAYSKTVEEPFLGTIYRDNPSSAFKRNADRLEKLTPPFSVTVKRLLSEREEKTIPLIDEEAPLGDRYRVFLGGPAGPWTVLTGNPEAEGVCLVISDSFGTLPTVLLTASYREVHYMDPRYFSDKALGRSLQQLIEDYGIEDVLLIHSETHSYETDFFTLLKRQLG